jgi:hypothetical protein
VEVSDQRIEMFSRNLSQCFVHGRGGNDFESATLQPFPKDGQDVLVFINQKYAMFGHGTLLTNRMAGRKPNVVPFGDQVLF